MGDKRVGGKTDALLLLEYENVLEKCREENQQKEFFGLFFAGSLSGEGARKGWSERQEEEEEEGGKQTVCVLDSFLTCRLAIF